MLFCDLNKQYSAFKKEIDGAIAYVMQSGQFISGPPVARLEQELGDFCLSSHVICCGNGTDALTVSLRALGIVPGDEVLVPDFTFIAPAECVSLVGAKPVFVDINADSFNIDPERIVEKINSKTKGIIAVSLFGQCAEFDEINAIADNYGLWVIEDAAQSFGATYGVKKSCTLTKIATTSFFPSKPLGCYGDGGAIFTSDSAFHHTARLMINHGAALRYHHEIIGCNSRLDSLQAAILTVKLGHLQEELLRRNKIAERYTKNLAGKVKTPLIDTNRVSTWAQYTVRSAQRESIIDHLRKNGVPTAIHYQLPLHFQKAFSMIANTEDKFPESESASREVFSLPMHSYLSDDEVDFISEKISEIAR